jgi:hypothetical protein
MPALPSAEGFGAAAECKGNLYESPMFARIAIMYASSPEIAMMNDMRSASLLSFLMSAGFLLEVHQMGNLRSSCRSKAV